MTNLKSPEKGKPTHRSPYNHNMFNTDDDYNMISNGGGECYILYSRNTKLSNNQFYFNV